MLDIKLTEEQYLCLLDDLLIALTKEAEQTLPENLTTNQKRWLLDGLLEVRAPGEFNETLFSMQDKLLSFENSTRGVKKLNQFKFVQGVADFDCELCRVETDVCVLFSPSLICLVDEQTETEKQTLLAAGVQVKESFGKIMQEYHNVLPATKTYMVDAANLPSKKIAKVLVKENQNLLPTDCAAFDLAVKDLIKQMVELKLNSVAFDLKTLNQIEPALVEIVKREFKQLKKLKIKVLKNL